MSTNVKLYVDYAAEGQPIVFDVKEFKIYEKKYATQKYSSRSGRHYTLVYEVPNTARVSGTYRVDVKTNICPMDEGLNSVIFNGWKLYVPSFDMDGENPIGKYSDTFIFVKDNTYFLFVDEDELKGKNLIKLIKEKEKELVHKIDAHFFNGEFFDKVSIYANIGEVDKNFIRQFKNEEIKHKLKIHEEEYKKFTESLEHKEDHSLTKDGRKVFTRGGFIVKIERMEKKWQ